MATHRQQNYSRSMFELALQEGEQILRQRTYTNMGLRFPADSRNGFDGRYEFKLYDGVSGVGIALLDLYAATGDSRYRETCEQISYGLVASTPENGPLHPGFFNGFAGVGYFHLACARFFKERKFAERAIEIGRRLDRESFIDTDLFRGAAGTGFFHLALYHATSDPLFLNLAAEAARFLYETALPIEPGIAWPVRDPRKPVPTGDESYGTLAADIHTGLAHGAAGICLFLLEFVRLTEDADANDLLNRALVWLESRSLRLRNGTVWPRSEHSRVIQDHWCHGSTGIAQMFLAKYRNRNESADLNAAESAAEATWNSLQGNLNEPFCHCHGLAGAIELFMDVGVERNSKLWLKRAKSIGNRLLNPAAIKSDAERAEGGGPSLGLGKAGIVRQLLRLANYPVFPILQLIREPLSLLDQDDKSKNGYIKGKSAEQSICNELLPYSAVQLKSGKHYLIAGLPRPEHSKIILEKLANAPAGSSYFDAVEKIIQQCRQLSQRYKDMVLDQTITPAVLGRVFRELAGLVLYSGGDPETVKRSVRKIEANAAAGLELTLSRLATDRKGVLAKLVQGRVKRMRMLGSDPHSCGQRAMLIEFEDGPPLVYKARSVAIDQELAGIDDLEPTLVQKCRSWLQPSIAGGLLPAHCIMKGSKWHGYVEQISATLNEFNPPDELDAGFTSTNSKPRAARLEQKDEKRYWYSAGLMAGYAFTLGIYDLHAENVVCGKSSATPKLSLHAIDLEMAFGNVLDLEDTQLIDGPRWDSNVQSHSHTAISHPSFECGLFAEEWVTDITRGIPEPVSRPWKAVRWIWPHLAQNSDGSFGIGAHVCCALRGFADQWMMMQTYSKEIASHLKKRLSGVPMRVVLKPTRNYVAALMERKLGGAPMIGIAVNSAYPFAKPLIPAEVQQLDELDIPYFFRILGNEPHLYWFNRSGDAVIDTDFRPLETITPFWSIVENQSDPNRLARAIVDLAWAAIPAAHFDFHEPSLGVRVVRTPDDSRVWIIVVLGPKRLVCSVSLEGKIEWWMDDSSHQ